MPSILDCQKSSRNDVIKTDRLKEFILKDILIIELTLNLKINVSTMTKITQNFLRPHCTPEYIFRDKILEYST